MASHTSHFTLHTSHVTSHTSPADFFSRKRLRNFSTEIGLLLIGDIQLNHSMNKTLIKIREKSSALSFSSPTVPAASLRIIGLSATIGNIHEISAFHFCNPSDIFNLDAGNLPALMDNNPIVITRKIAKSRKLCMHNKRRYNCKDCKGSGICVHNKRRYSCKLCKGQPRLRA